MYSLSRTMTVSCVWMFLAELSSWVWAWPLWPGPAVTLVISQETSRESAGDTGTGDEEWGTRGEEDGMVMAGTCSS